MIYKIDGDFSSGMPELISSLKDNYDIMFQGNSMYASLKSIKKTNNILKLKEFRSFLITLLTEDNLKYESDIVIEWARKKFVSLDTEKFENEQQEKLIQMSEFIDQYEQEIQKLIQENNNRKE